MSSTSLSSPPSQGSPWRISQPLPLEPTDHNAEAGPSEPNLVKRRRSEGRVGAAQLLSPSTRPSKRVRQPTPVPSTADEANSLAPAAPETEACLSGLSVPDFFVSTATGISSAPFEIDLTLRGQVQQTSEGDRSVLFSDQQRQADDEQGQLARLVDEECLSPKMEPVTRPQDADGDDFHDEGLVAEAEDFAPDPDFQDEFDQDDDRLAVLRERQTLNDSVGTERDEADAVSAQRSLFLPASTIASGSAGPVGSSRPGGLFAVPHHIERPQTRQLSTKLRNRSSLLRAAEPDVIEEDELEEDDSGSYHSGDSSDFEMDYRPILDRTAVKHDIGLFVDGLGTALLEEEDTDTVVEKYKVVDRLGEGTFSSVYLAHDCLHNRHDNTFWTGELPVTESDEEQEIRSDVRVALKKILCTSSPQRIENELHILESLRGCRHVSQLITAFRERDQVIIVLPYHRSDDFRHFYRLMDPLHMKKYMQCLFRALKDIHKRGIVHRDVKPANFLFDYEAGTGILCDFGLAERYVPPRRPTCQHAPGTLEKLHGSKVKTNETGVVEQAHYDARKKARLPEGRLGFLHEDKRPAMKTNRAGTRGFRAPEVLLKCPDQTVAIDCWSAGVMLLSMLCHKFPIFNSNDDVEALMEIAAIFGKSVMERCALLHNRTFICNAPTVESPPASLQAVILKLNPHLYTPPLSHPTSHDAKAHIEAIDDAIDLCNRLLRPDATKRLTAAGALRHPFLRPQKGESMEDVLDEEEALTPQEGKCGNLHITLPGSGIHKIMLARDELDMAFGQGIPPDRDALCPEHEHFQQRTGQNPLLWAPPTKQASQSTVVDSLSHAYEESDELEVDDEGQDELGDDQAGSDTLVDPHVSESEKSRLASGREILGEVTNIPPVKVEVSKQIDAKASLMARGRRESNTTTMRV